MASSEPAPPAGYRARPAGRDDLPAIDALYEAAEGALGMRHEARSGYLGWRWSQPYLDLARDTRVVESPDGLAAFSMLVDDGLGGPLGSMACVHPAHAGRGIGSWLVDRALAHAAGRGLAGVRTNAPRPDGAAKALLQGRGFARTRTSFDMGTALDGAPVPAPPAGVTIRAARTEVDDRLLWELATVAFRDHWDHTEDASFEAFSIEWFGDPDARTRALVAEVDGEPAGELGWVVEPNGAYVISVGVLPAYRRRGVARALLHRAMADAAAEGQTAFSLSVDAQSPTGAVGLYEGAGLAVWRTFDIYERGAS